MVMVINENDRIFQAWGSVEIRDKQGDLIKMKDFEPVMLSMMKRGAPVIDNHSNRVVGKILNYEFKDKKVGEKDIPGLLLTCQIYDDFETDDEVWSDIKDGNATGMSFGGRARSKESIWFEGQPTNLLRKLEAFEFTVVREGRNPANPEAKMIAATIAKSDDYVEFCKVGVCKVCDKETKVLKSENLNNYDDIIKSMSGDDVTKSDFLKAMSVEYDMEVQKARVWVKNSKVKGGGYWQERADGKPKNDRINQFRGGPLKWENLSSKEQNRVTDLTGSIIEGKKIGYDEALRIVENERSGSGAQGGLNKPETSTPDQISSRTLTALKNPQAYEALGNQLANDVARNRPLDDLISHFTKIGFDESEVKSVISAKLRNVYSFHKKIGNEEEANKVKTYINSIEEQSTSKPTDDWSSDEGRKQIYMQRGMSEQQATETLARERSQADMNKKPESKLRLKPSIRAKLSNRTGVHARDGYKWVKDPKHPKGGYWNFTGR
jgi:hypothetical protein